MSLVTGTAEQDEFLQQLIAAGHILPSGESGLYGRGMMFEDVRNGVDNLITGFGLADQPERPRFPPMIPRRLLERVGYLKSFPHLCGSIFSFKGSEASTFDLVEQANKGEDWSGHLEMTDVVMTPAACYPAYPVVGARGPLPNHGATLDLGGSYVYRNEPSGDPARLQMFHQREMIRVGSAEQVLEWRECWIARAVEIFGVLELDANLDVASDPFFGRGGKILAKNQKEQKLKFEVLVPIVTEGGTAVSSFNYHQQHFATVFDIRQNNGELAHTACLGFGLERITIALFKKHGLDPSRWPKSLRTRLWPMPTFAEPETVGAV
jgi:seryl-tRNA synthetase